MPSEGEFDEDEPPEYEIPSHDGENDHSFAFDSSSHVHGDRISDETGFVDDNVAVTGSVLLEDDADDDTGSVLLEDTDDDHDDNDDIFSPDSRHIHLNGVETSNILPEDDDDNVGSFALNSGRHSNLNGIHTGDSLLGGDDDDDDQNSVIYSNHSHSQDGFSDTLAVDDPSDHMLTLDDPSDDELFVEKDPSGRYGRYSEVLGRGAMKTVYRAYDLVDCKEVAWNKASSIIDCPKEQSLSVKREVCILQSLNHKAILKLYQVWINDDSCEINFITELCSSTLLEHRLKHKHVSRKAVQTWGRQIVEGLAHLHSHYPPIIHRDLKCENILVKCRSSRALKIGDFGTATFLPGTRHMHTLVGTPEFMAPEMFQEDYNELVDVYSFGMCMLELLTGECPYSECNSLPQVFKKVISGEKPNSLLKVKDIEALNLINRCLLPASQRPSVIELLSDPFLQCKYTSSNSVKGLNQGFHGGSSNANGSKAAGQAFSNGTSNGCNHCEANAGKAGDHPETDVEELVIGNLSDHPKDLEEVLSEPVDGFSENSICNTHEQCFRRKYCVTGKREDENTLSLQIRILESGRSCEIDFDFDLRADTPTSVAEEMVRFLGYPETDLAMIADLISKELAELASNLDLVLSMHADMEPKVTSKEQSENDAVGSSGYESRLLDVDGSDGINNPIMEQVQFDGSHDCLLKHGTADGISGSVHLHNNEAQFVSSRSQTAPLSDDHIGSAMNETTIHEAQGEVLASLENRTHLHHDEAELVGTCSQTAPLNDMYIGSSVNGTRVHEMEGEVMASAENRVMCLTLPKSDVSMVGNMEGTNKSSNVNYSELETSMANGVSSIGNKSATDDGINNVTLNKAVSDFASDTRLSDGAAVVHNDEPKNKTMTGGCNNTSTDNSPVYLRYLFPKKNPIEKKKTKFKQATAGIGIVLEPPSEQGVRRPVTSFCKFPSTIP